MKRYIFKFLKTVVYIYALYWLLCFIEHSVAFKKNYFYPIINFLLKTIDPPPNEISQPLDINNSLKINLPSSHGRYVYLVEFENAKCILIRKDKIRYPDYFFNPEKFPTLNICLLGNDSDITPGNVMYEIRRRSKQEFKHVEISNSVIVDVGMAKGLRVDAKYVNAKEAAIINIYILNQNSRKYLIYYFSTVSEKRSPEGIALETLVKNISYL